MATCQKCFKQIPEEAKRCPFCGVAVEVAGTKPKKTMFGFAPAMPPKPVTPKPEAPKPEALKPEAPGAQTVKTVVPPRATGAPSPKSVIPAGGPTPPPATAARDPRPVRPKSVVPPAIIGATTRPGGTSPPDIPPLQPKSVVPPAPSSTDAEHTPAAPPAPSHQQIVLPRGGKANIDDRAKTMVPGALAPAKPTRDPAPDPASKKLSGKAMIAAAVGVPHGPSAADPLRPVDSGAKTLVPGALGQQAWQDAKTMDPTNAMAEQLSLGQPAASPADQDVATAPTITPATGVPVVSDRGTPPAAPPVAAPPVAAPPVAAPPVAAPPVAAPDRVATPAAAPAPAELPAGTPPGAPASPASGDVGIEIGSVPTIPSGLPGLKLHDDEHLIAVETPSNQFWLFVLLGFLLVLPIPFAIWLLLRAGRAYVLTNLRAVRVGRGGEIRELAHRQLAECRPASFLGIEGATLELVPRAADAPALEFTFCGPREAAARLQGMLRFWLAEGIAINDAPQVDARNRIREPVFDLHLVLIPQTRCQTVENQRAGLLVMTPERLIWLPEQLDGQENGAIVPVTAFAHALARRCETIDAFEQEVLRVGQTGLLAVSVARRWDALSELSYSRGKGLTFVDGETGRPLAIFVPSQHETTVRSYLANLGLLRPTA